VMVKLLTYLTKMVPRGGIEPPTRGFSRLVLVVTHCLYCVKMLILVVCEKLCDRALGCVQSKHCVQHSNLKHCV
jgi:hypothetical protein